MDRLQVESASFERIVVTDTIPDGGRLTQSDDRLVKLSVAPLMGEALHRIHHDMSISRRCSSVRPEPSDRSQS